MPDLYLSDVPHDVMARLERLAEREATSVAAVAVRELAESTRRADDPALLSALPHLDVPAAASAQALAAERAER